jgi:hypothetical protein
MKCSYRQDVGTMLRRYVPGNARRLNPSTFPRAPEELLMPTVETVELEQEQTLEAWADAHPHAMFPRSLLGRANRIIE